jgi:hypothetical protein
MGVPFEALIPFGIMLAVRLSLPYPLYRTDEDIELSFVDVRSLWSWIIEDQTHAERGKERKALG